MPNALYFGDCLHVLKEHVRDESVDLVYLDPPFNSKVSYNILFKSPVGEKSDAQLHAFQDTWRWEDGAEQAMEEVSKKSVSVLNLLSSLKCFLGQSDVMAYLAMMAPRLLELRRVIKPTGSLYLHCDPTASHYLKVLLDGVFAPQNFKNEIIWLRSKNPKGSQHANKRYSPHTDTLLFYGKSDDAYFNADAVRLPLTETELEAKYEKVDGHGRWLDGPILCSDSMGPRPNLVYAYKGFTPGPSGWRVNLERLKEIDAQGNLYWTATGAPRRKFRPEDDRGAPVGNFWGDISPVNSQAQERIGYPTQKPLALLERIIKASSRAGDTVLDPFCGCGTAIHAAEKLGRKWIGIDITYLAIQVIEDRLKTWLPSAKYALTGIPEDELAARRLAQRDPYTFQLWAVGRVGGQPRGRGADKGIDGEIAFLRGLRDYGRGIVSVKGGQHVTPDMVRALKGTVERERADIGIFICLDPPTRDMRTEAHSGGRINLPGGNRPRIQIVTVEDLIAGPNLGIITTLNTLQAAEAARVVARVRRRKKTPSELRREPQMPLPIAGGRAKERQRPLPLGDPLLAHPQPNKKRSKTRTV